MENKNLTWAFLLAFPFALPGTALGAAPAAPAAYEAQLASAVKPDAGSSEGRRLWNLFDVYWKYQMTENPEWATYAGYPGQNGRWTDFSTEAVARRKRQTRSPLEALKSIDRSKLDDDDRLDYDIFKRTIEDAAAGAEFPSELMPVYQLGGPQIGLADTLESAPRAATKDFEDILSRLQGVPVLIDQTMGLMREGLKRGVVEPKIVLRDVAEQIQSQAVDDPSKSPFLSPFEKFPSTIPAAERGLLRERAVKAVRDKISPAFKRLHAFFVDEYLPGCRESIALTALSGGQAWYEYAVRTHTTTDMKPKEIHELGLSEVKRIRAEMDEVIKETGFKGDFHEFTTYLRTDPKFFFKTPADLLTGYRDIAKRIDPELVRLFGKLPRLTYGVTPVPAYSEKSQTTAYYQQGTLSGGRPGQFFANTYKVETRPKWEMEALTLHEAVPGHHLQISLQQEMERLPDFRKQGEFTAYTEGWGLYSESLGSEIGLYKDPYSRFGQLTYEIWRAVRLVVDTGMHQFGWSRKQAIDYFMANSSKSEHDVTVEIDRYIVWPGQALAYKIGQLKIRGLRELARKELGDRFDIRAFHDVVLAQGSVPLTVLEDQVKLWIEKTKAAPAAK